MVRVALEVDGVAAPTGRVVGRRRRVLRLDLSTDAARTTLARDGRPAGVQRRVRRALRRAGDVSGGAHADDPTVARHFRRGTEHRALFVRPGAVAAKTAARGWAP